MINHNTILIAILVAMGLTACDKQPAQPEPPATLNPTAIKILQDLESPLATQEIQVQQLQIHARDHGIYVPENRVSAKGRKIEI
jgi:hypothetical protein